MDELLMQFIAQLEAECIAAMRVTDNAQDNLGWHRAHGFRLGATATMGQDLAERFHEEQLQAANTLAVESLRRLALFAASAKAHAAQGAMA